MSVLYAWCGVMRAETGGQCCILSSFHLWDGLQGPVRPEGTVSSLPAGLAVGLYYDCVLDRVHKGGEIWLQVPRAGSQETTSPTTFGRQNDEIGIWTRL